MFVFCEDTTCCHNDGTGCLAPVIVIKVTTGTREDGTNGAIDMCSNYRGKNDATD